MRGGSGAETESRTVVRVAHIVENFGAVSETFVASVACGLIDEGLEVLVLTDTRARGQELPDTPVAVRETRCLSRHRRLVAAAEYAVRALRRPSVRLRFSARLASRTLARHLRAYAPHAAYIDFGQNAVLAWRALARLEIPFVVHFHGRDASALLGRADYLREVRQVFAHAASVLAPSKHIRRRLVLAGCDEARVEVVPNGVRASDFPAPQWERRRAQPPSVIHVGRLVEKKSPLALVHAFRLVKQTVGDAVLTIVGDGPLESAVAQRVAQLGLTGSVRMLGSLPHARVREQLADHWVYAQHSVTASNGDQEGFAISLIEAGVSGLPVVSTLHDGIPENVLEGETGFLVPEHDFERMADRITALLSDFTLVRRMGEAARRRVSEDFRIERKVQRLAEILREVSTRAAHRGGK